MRKSYLWVWLIALMLPFVGYSQNLSDTITQIQYFYNTDPGVGIAGNGGIENVTATDSLEQTFNWTLPGSLTEGIHTLFVRAKDQEGRWSIAMRRSFLITTPPADIEITKLQYFFNTDPGVGVAGNGAIIDVGPADTLDTNLAISLPGSLTEGLHTLFVRVRDQHGRWSIINRRSFLIVTPPDDVEITKLQYFFDADSGFVASSNGEIIDVGPTDTLDQSFVFNMPSYLGEGLHTLFVRVRDQHGRWSIVNRRSFLIVTPPDDLDVTKLQWFVDSDPGVGIAGNGAVVDVGPTDTLEQTFAFNLPTLTEGIHTLFVRVRDQYGRWSIVNRRTFLVVKPVDNMLITHLEYYYNNDPGVGNGNPIDVVDSDTIDQVYDMEVPCLPTGQNFLYVRVRDQHGRWSIIVRDTLDVTSGIAAATVSPAGPLSICPGESVMLSFDSLPGIDYVWRKDGVDLPNDTNSTLVVTTAGDYSVKSTCNGVFTTSNEVTVSELPVVTYYADADGDGYGDAAVDSTDCTQPAGYVQNSTDCDDTNSSINPGATESCNGIDDDCDGSIDEGVQTTYYADGDVDGYGDPAVDSTDCTQPAGYVSNNTDCDDGDANEFPGQIWYIDADGDGYGGSSTTACERPADGYLLSELTGTGTDDCNDGDASINPAASETCNGIDDDCNSLIDDGLPFTTWYHDADGDGYGDPGDSQSTCDGAPSGYIADNTDCNDADANEYPGQTWYLDADGDGYGVGTSTTGCARPADHYTLAELTSTTGDCDDTNSSINPAATESCNGVDDDCDTQIDEGVKNTYYADADGDGYGDASDSLEDCAPPSGYVADNTDCDDGNAAINPGASEACNGIDDDCNSLVDDGLPFVDYYQDADGDGYGNAAVDSKHL